MGLGLISVSSEMRLPKPPARMATFTRLLLSNGWLREMTQALDPLDPRPQPEALRTLGRVEDSIGA